MSVKKILIGPLKSKHDRLLEGKDARQPLAWNAHGGTSLHSEGGREWKNMNK